MNTMARYLPRQARALGGGVVGSEAGILLSLVKLGFALCSILFQRLEKRIKYEERDIRRTTSRWFTERSEVHTRD